MCWLRLNDIPSGKRLHRTARPQTLPGKRPDSLPEPSWTVSRRRPKMGADIKLEINRALRQHVQRFTRD